MKPSYEFKKHCLVLLMSVLIFSLSGCSKGSVRNQSQHEGYPIADDVQTTFQMTIAPGAKPSTAINLWEISKYSQYGYGNWTYGPGLPYEKRLDLMEAVYSGNAVTKKTKLLNFFTISDIHITDKESPNQLIYLQRLHPTLLVGGSLYSGIMLYTTHVLDATVQTVNALHKQNPIDFGLSVGDTCNTTQVNELRWDIDVLDGKVIAPSSGDHFGADIIDYQKPYKAVGLDKTIAWYQTLGNHDHFWLGSITEVIYPEWIPTVPYINCYAVYAMGL